MVNKYKRKTSQASWLSSTMRQAMLEVQELGKSTKSVATKYGIPRTTLQRHLQSGSFEKKLGRFVTVFSPEQETELLEYVFHMDALFYGLSKKEFLELVFNYAEINNIPHQFKNGTAGLDWYKGFIDRHPDLTLRKPEPTSIARARGFNKPQVYRFFNLLEEQIEKHKVDATRLYNMDETGIQTSSNKPPRILTKTGKRQVGVISSTEKGRTTTVICCCNAAGSFIPPFMIFARKRMNSRLLDGAPPSTQGSCSDNGWINGPVFLEWLKFFVDTVRPTADRKIILVLDNHESHKYLPALEFASKSHVIFVSLAPHTTHRMQPLDFCVYGPLKNYFEQAVSVFQKAHAGRIINQNDVAKLFANAYVKAATAHNAINGFRSTGLYPPNRFIFDESDFLPASVTENPLGQSRPEQHISVNNLQTPSTSHQIDMEVNTKSLTINHNTQNSEELCSSTFSQEEKEPNETINNLSNPSCSTVSPMNIRPVPNVAPNKSSRRRTVQRSEVLTSTPIKNEQRVKMEKKKRKDSAKSVKRNMNKDFSEEVFSKKLKQNANGKKKIEKPAARYYCFVCHDPYENPANEDWIKCDDCDSWAHESCTAYSGIGSFFCDICQEI